MKLLSWNVNGLRSALGKGFLDFLKMEDPHVLCLQESRVLPEQITFAPEGYDIFWNPAEKKGYSGTMVLSKVPPLHVETGIKDPVHDTEGRVLNVEFDHFTLVNVYTPNSGDGLKRLDYRQEWDRAFLKHLKKLQKKKPVIVCGDLNVAHEEIDLKHPDRNRTNAGFTDEERKGFSTLLKNGFIDTFRHEHPDEPDHYSWWSYRGNARKNNSGWRIDYFLADTKIHPSVKNPRILSSVMGSDHCPVGIEVS